MVKNLKALLLILFVFLVWIGSTLLQAQSGIFDRTGGSSPAMALSARFPRRTSTSLPGMSPPASGHLSSRPQRPRCRGLARL
ncbi:MAG: hypothetical protein MZU79_03940 [Anaerotruncus sp.]|nr:hypothetical protein [Anaerotruncus sp.]